MILLMIFLESDVSDKEHDYDQEHEFRIAGRLTPRASILAYAV